jgi:hypothetical protein
MEPREKPAPHGNTKWTQEEIYLLLDLNERYKDRKSLIKRSLEFSLLRQ